MAVLAVGLGATRPGGHRFMDDEGKFEMRSTKSEINSQHEIQVLPMDPGAHGRSLSVSGGSAPGTPAFFALGQQHDLRAGGLREVSMSPSARGGRRALGMAGIRVRCLAGGRERFEGRAGSANA